MEFTKDNALALLDASTTVDFPVDFDAAWQWLVYSTKGHGLVAYKGLGFKEGRDFLRERVKTPNVGRSNDCYHLSIGSLSSKKASVGRPQMPFLLRCANYTVGNVCKPRRVDV